MSEYDLQRMKDPLIFASIGALCINLATLQARILPPYPQMPPILHLQHRSFS